LDYGVKTFTDDYPFETATNQKYVSQCNDWVRNWVSVHYDKKSRILEIGPNDGSLLRCLREAGYQPEGIEPVRRLADKAGCMCGLFEDQAPWSGYYDLIIANNVIAHTPRIAEFVANLKQFLSPKGMISIEFPPAQRLAKQWDTIYHEHYNYFTLYSLQNILNASGLQIAGWDEIESHGGSIRVRITHGNFKYTSIEPAHLSFDDVAFEKIFWLDKLYSIRLTGHKLAAYGAPAKGNTFLNTLGIKSGLIDFVVDDTPYKQGKFLPGSRIPIFGVEKLWSELPDYVLILPWNHWGEIQNKITINKPKHYNPKIIGADHA
jgi:SAM-dependent methyltransferase